MTPTVSVIISTYERPQLLQRALRSVQTQDYRDYEVIVVDDCSPSQNAVYETLARAHDEFAALNIPFDAVTLPENSGYQSVPKNHGIMLARGAYIAYLDDDNTWRPHHLSKLVSAIESDFSHDMVYSRLCYHIEDAETRARLVKEFGGQAPEGDAEGQPWIPQLLAVRNFIDTSTILHSRGGVYKLVRDCGYAWDEDLRRFGDWNFVWRWASFGLNAKLVNEVTVDYYWHPGSLQITRLPMEIPVCSSYTDYLAGRSAAAR